MLGNKEIISKNIRQLMSQKGVTATDVCKELGFKHNTFSDWINAKAYPRIDKIEMMAKYFGVSKAALVEDYDMHKSYVLTEEDEQNLIKWYREASEPERDMIKRIISVGGDDNG